MQEPPAHERDHRFRITIEPDTGDVVVRADGPMDLTCRALLTTVVAGALEELGERRIVIDLEDVELIDSAGLGELMDALLRCDDAEARWQVLPSPAVERLLLLVGVGRRRSDETGSWLSGGYGDH